MQRSALTWKKLNSFALLALACASVLGGCKKPSPAEDAPALEELPVVPPAEAPTPEAPAEDAPPLASAPVPDRIDPQDRFIHPELVESIRVRSGLIPPQPPRVEGLLMRSDLRDVLRFGGDIELAGLPGRDPSPNYDAMRWSTGGAFGCAVQRWQYDSPAEVDAVYKAFTDSLIDAVVEPRVDVAAVQVAQQGLLSFAFKHVPSRSMVQLSCEETLADVEAVRELVNRIVVRL